MRYDRCPICEEKLRDGVCPMCGYDFKRLDGAGQARPQFEQRMTPKYKRPEPSKNDQKKSRSARKQRAAADWNLKKTRRNFGKPKKKSRKAVIAIVIVIISLAADFLPDIVETVYEYKDQIIMKITGEDPGSSSRNESDPYQYADYQLSADGEHFETDLGAGEYAAGIDLPEGIYQVTCTTGDVNLSIRNRDQGVSEYDYYKEEIDEDEDFYYKTKEVHLYQGSYIKVDGNGTLNLVTESAQTDQLSQRTDNPLTETIKLKKNAVAGKDFPAGTYDITAEKAYGTLVTKYKTGESEDSYENRKVTVLQAVKDRIFPGTRRFRSRSSCMTE